MQTSEQHIKTKCLYLMFLSSKNLVRHFWMMWSTKSDSGIRFSDCRSFSKDLTWRQKMALPCAAGENYSISISYQNSLQSIISCRKAFWSTFLKSDLVKLWNTTTHCSAGLPSHSVPPCQRPGPCSWCQPACSAPSTSPGTEHTTWQKAELLTHELRVQLSWPSLQWLDALSPCFTVGPRRCRPECCRKFVAVMRVLQSVPFY